MDAPDSQALERALDAIQANDADGCTRILEEVLQAHPTGEIDVAALDGAGAGMAEKAWACVGLARQRIDEGRHAVVRVMLRSAIDHAREEVEEGGRMEPGGHGLLG